MFDLPSELLAAIDAGEDSYLELKEIVVEGNRILVAAEGRAVPWLARQISAFANSDGGVLVLGVADDGRLIGVPPVRLDDLQRLVVDATRDGVEPPADHLVGLDAMTLPTRDGTVTVLKVDIRADYFSVHAPKGRRPFVRAGNTTREVSMEHLPRLLARRSSMLSADERPVLGATWDDDIDQERLAAYHRSRFGRPADDLARFAMNIRVTARDDLDVPHPTVAGLLLFGRAPLTRLPHAGIDLVAYGGTEPDTDQRIDTRAFDGSVTGQIDAVMTYLRASPHLATASAKDATGRRDLPSYSERALQECIVNAVAHRDYAIAGRIRVQVFVDRIEVTNPGRLPNSLSPDDLFAGAQPIRRNQILVGFLSQPATWPSGRAAMEGMAEGFLTMVRETERLTGRRPELRQHTEALTVTIPARPAS